MPTPTRVKQHEELQLSKIEAFILSLQKALERELASASRGIDYAPRTDAARVKQIAKIQRILESFSYEKDKSRIDEIFANELAFVKEGFEYYGTPIKYTQEEKQIVKALITLELNKIDNEINSFVGDVRTVLVSNVILGNVPNLVAIADEFGDRFARNVKTELNTSSSMFNGEMSYNKAIEAFGKNPRMLYVGPVDGVTRPFCLKHVGKVYRLSDVRKMDNGQGLDVVTAKGGYNCRHSWNYISDEYDTTKYEATAARQKESIKKK